MPLTTYERNRRFGKMKSVKMKKAPVFSQPKNESYTVSPTEMNRARKPTLIWQNELTVQIEIRDLLLELLAEVRKK